MNRLILSKWLSHKPHCDFSFLYFFSLLRWKLEIGKLNRNLNLPMFAHHSGDTVTASLTSSPFLLVRRLKDVRFFLLAEFLSELWGTNTCGTQSSVISSLSPPSQAMVIKSVIKHVMRVRDTCVPVVSWLWWSRKVVRWLQRGPPANMAPQSDGAWNTSPYCGTAKKTLIVSIYYI